VQVDGIGFPVLELAIRQARRRDRIHTPSGVRSAIKYTISTGIISGLNRNVDGRVYIQTTAAISSGSSGGVLLDGAGRVIGVTSATAVGAQNINLAIPSNDILKLDRTKLSELRSILPEMKYYDDLFPVPDFGAFANTELYKADTADKDKTVFYYRADDLKKTMTVESAFEGYERLLEQNTCSFYGYAIEEGKIINYYINSAYKRLITFGEKTVDGVDCIRIQVMQL
jgi:hypothetical protein